MSAGNYIKLYILVRDNGITSARRRETNTIEDEDRRPVIVKSKTVGISKTLQCIMSNNYEEKENDIYNFAPPLLRKVNHLYSVYLTYFSYSSSSSPSSSSSSSFRFISFCSGLFRFDANRLLIFPLLYCHLF